MSRLRAAALLFAAALLALASGCTPAAGGQPEAGAAPAPDLAVAVLSSDLAVGPARLALALRGRAGQTPAGGPLHLRLTPPSAAAPALEATALPRPSGIAGLTLYVATIAFPVAGVWEVQVEAPSGRPATPLTGHASVEVHAATATPPVGAPAPLASVPHLAGGTSLAQRTALPAPDPALYQADPAAVIGRGKPVVLTIAAPSLCPGGACAAQAAALSDLHARFAGRLHVIHADPYPTQPLPAELPAVLRAWNLRTQPWTFVVDARGSIAARFEGFAGVEELREVVARVLASAPE